MDTASQPPAKGSGSSIKEAGKAVVSPPDKAGGKKTGKPAAKGADKSADAKGTAKIAAAKGAPKKASPNALLETAKKLVVRLGLRNLLHDEGAIELDVANEKAAIKKRDDIIRIVTYQFYAIAVLIGVLLLGVPFFQPSFEHYSLDSKQEVQPLVTLDMPNLTNEAVLSWVTTTVTEVMTLGFGDFDKQLIAQRDRFTAKGWLSFREALERDNMREVFKERQLVLTTVPGDTPVIVGQGFDENDVYVWQVELPIIMTYTTNNNVMQKSKAIIALTITRVPVDENENGLAIKLWRLGGK